MLEQKTMQKALHEDKKTKRKIQARADVAQKARMDTSSDSESDDQFDLGKKAHLHEEAKQDELEGSKNVEGLVAGINPDDGWKNETP